MFYKIKIKNSELNRGMTYIELIVVLSIFSIMSGVVLFNYRSFQDKVEIRNLANDIALKIVQAQKDSSNGKLPPAGHTPTISNWKPSYGLYFNRAVNDKAFSYFADLSNAGFCDSSCDLLTDGFDYLDTINITRGNSISKLEVFYLSAPTVPVIFQNLSLTFSRSGSGVIIGAYVSSAGYVVPNVSHVLITISSPSAVTSGIKIYSSGRIQIN